jgi:hypothetical protein
VFVALPDTSSEPKPAANNVISVRRGNDRGAFCVTSYFNSPLTYIQKLTYVSMWTQNLRVRLSFHNVWRDDNGREIGDFRIGISIGSQANHGAMQDGDE